jgi:hypothetical protein
MIDSKLEELLDKQINLFQGHVSQGSTSHTYIRTLLGNRRTTDPSFPWLLDGDFLSGSYARGTKLHPLDDIDVMIVLDGTGLIPTNISATHYVRSNAEGANGPVHNLLGIDNLLDSRVVLDTFHKSLKQSHTDSAIKKHGQAVNVKLSSYGLGIDIVPCFHIKPKNSSEQDFYYIPAGDGSASWLKTNPKIDATISDRLHNQHNKKLKSIIKLLKYWNREKNADRIRSYHLEAIAWYVFHNHPSAVNSLSEGVKYFFDNARPYLESYLFEPTGFGKHIDANMTPEDRQLSLIALESAKAVLHLQGLLPSIPSWRKVFGDKFGN